MLRKVSTQWSNFSLLKLREESALNGIRKLSNREEILTKLIELEKSKKILNTVEDKTSSEHPTHKHLSKLFVYREIFKRNPDFPVTPSLTKNALIGTLINLLVEERGSGAKDLRLLLKGTSVNDDLTIKEILSVFETFQDPYSLSQTDINTLMHTEPSSLVPIWTLLTKNVNSLNFNSVKVVLGTANTIQLLFKKRLVETEHVLSREAVDLFVTRALDQSQEASSQACAAVLKSASSLYESEFPSVMKSLQCKMIEKYRIGTQYENDALGVILENLPSGCYSMYKAEVDEMVLKASENLHEFSNEEIVKIVFGIYNAGCKVPFRFYTSLDGIPMEVYKRLQPQVIYKFCEVLMENRLLSENLAITMLDSMMTDNLFDKDFLEIFANYLYMHHKYGHLQLILSKQKPLGRILMCEANLSLTVLLKCGVVYSAHLAKEDFFTKILLGLLNYSKTDPIMKENLNLVTELFGVLLEVCKERPIYNYQFNSFETIKTDVKDRVVNRLFEIIQANDPSSSMVFEYFSEYEGCEKPEIKDFDVEVTDQNFLKMCKSVWRHKIDVCEDLMMKAEGRVAFEEKDFTEALFYLSCFEGVKKSLKLAWLKPGPYFLAACYNLGAECEVTQKLLELLDEQKLLFGEPLLKTLIRISQVDKEAKVFNLTSNFNFTPIVHPSPDPSLIITFFNTIQDHQSPLDNFACSTLIYLNISSFTHTETLFLYSFLKKHWKSINSDLQKAFEKYLKPSEITEIIGQSATVASITKFFQTQEPLKATLENLSVFEILIKYHIYSSKIVQDFLELMSNSPPAAALAITSQLLELISHSGNNQNHFDTLCKQIQDQNLWSEMSVDDFINFFFIIHFSKHSKIRLPGNIEEEFKFNLLKIDHGELLFEHPNVKLNCYKAFKYTTEFEPRYLVSNDLKIRQIAPELTLDIDLPQREIARFMKMYALLLFYGVEPSEECVKGIKMYYKNREKNAVVNAVKSELLEMIQKDLGIKYGGIDIQDDVGSDKILWKYDLGFKVSNLSYLVVTSQDYSYDANGNVIGISLINIAIKTQLEDKTGIKVIPIVVDSWNNYGPAQKSAFVKLVGKALSPPE